MKSNYFTRYFLRNLKFKNKESYEYFPHWQIKVKKNSLLICRKAIDQLIIIQIQEVFMIRDLGTREFN